MSKTKLFLVIIVMVIFAEVSLLIIANNSNTVLAINTPVIVNNATSTILSKQYSIADISTHASATDCWSTVNGKVYDLTSWINKHPGGAEAILSICGNDGSAAFNDQHGGQRRPANELAGFIIGTLK